MLGRSPRRGYSYGSKAHLRLAEQADWNDRVEAVYDLCRQVRAGAKSKRDPYEPPRPSSAIQTERNSLVASIKKRRGRMTRTDLSEVARGIPFFATLLALACIAFIVFW